jgi:hypothetical protein
MAARDLGALAGTKLGVGASGVGVKTDCELWTAVRARPRSRQDNYIPTTPKGGRRREVCWLRKPVARR